MHLITVDVKMEEDVLRANRELAENNRKKFEEHGVRAFDFMGAIGSGKTEIIERLTDMLKERGIRVGAITGDVAGDEDYRRVRKHGVDAVNVNTGKECHLDAHRIQHAIEKIDLDAIDILFIENVGNLVCPADFPLGTEKRLVVISVTEGDDMVRKHPVIFGQADIMVVNKIDIARYVGVDPETLVSDYRKLKPSGAAIKTCAKTGEGVDKLIKAMNL